VLGAVPAIGGIVLGVALRGFGVDVVVAASAGAMLGSVLMVAESCLLIHWSDSRYERFDITSENIIETE